MVEIPAWKTNLITIKIMSDDITSAASSFSFSAQALKLARERVDASHSSGKPRNRCGKIHAGLRATKVTLAAQLVSRMPLLLNSLITCLEQELSRHLPVMHGEPMENISLCFVLRLQALADLFCHLV